MESNSNTLLNVLVRFCKVAPLGSSLHQIRELQPWSMEYGVWSMEYRVWSTEYGVWSMEYVGVNIKCGVTTSGAAGSPQVYYNSGN